MKLSGKELDALAWVAQQASLGMLDVEAVRDGSDVGWLLARFKAKGVTSHYNSMLVWRVSPLGHVYEHESGELLREGPKVWPQSVAQLEAQVTE